MVVVVVKWGLRRGFKAAQLRSLGFVLLAIRLGFADFGLIAVRGRARVALAFGSELRKFCAAVVLVLFGSRLPSFWE